MLNKGLSYKDALNKAFDIYNLDKLSSNDILAISYIKAINKINKNIIPISIKRTNDYNSNVISGNIISANLIRKKIDSINISSYVPSNALVNYYKPNFYNYLKYKIYSSIDSLNEFKLVDEGIENRIKKYIDKSNSFNELVNSIKTKRYSYNKIKRMLLCIMLNIKKDSSNDINYIRILGFNSKGRKHLNSIKKNIDINLYTNFNKELEEELNITRIYSMIVDDDSLIEKEIKNLIIF